MSTITQQLAEFCATIDCDQLPSPVRERAKQLIFDTVGIALRARFEAAATPSLLAAVERLGLAQGDMSVIGDNQSYSAPPCSANSDPPA